MTKIYDLPQIKSVLKDIDMIGIIETVADLTGVAVQDIQIAKAVFQALNNKKN